MNKRRKQNETKMCLFYFVKVLLSMSFTVYILRLYLLSSNVFNYVSAKKSHLLKRGLFCCCMASGGGAGL